MESPRPGKVFRSSTAPRTPTVPLTTYNNKYPDFGYEAPIIDFYDDGYITEFAPLGQILEHGAEKIMLSAYEKFVEEQPPDEENSWPWLGVRKLRWIHVPANNMEWAERVIKCVWKAKKLQNKKHDRKANGNAGKPRQLSTPDEDSVYDMRDADLETPVCLRPEYWEDQQRGCISNCAAHPLYARHMVPFFSTIPENLDSVAALKSDTKEPKPKKPANKSSQSSINKSNQSKAQKDNMVLFMPYLHWSTSGNQINERNALIKGLAKAFKTPGYQRPSAESIDQLDIPRKLKLMRAFLFPNNDRCLHIRRTLDQFYYSTLPQALADERTIDQVVYRFAKKQHQQKEIEEAERKSKETLYPAGSRVSSSESTTEKSSLFQTIAEIVHDEDIDMKEPSWDPPKIMMVNQLWLWVIDGDTVVTSFPAKLKSDLDIFKEKKARDSARPLDGCDDCDYTRGDDLYDSTDIWRAVFREFRLNTEYGKRSQKSALDLAWTIADQALGVFHKRNLHPHLQFIEMFEMEINEITFKQAEAFDTFSSNVQLAHYTNDISKLLGLLEFFQRAMFPIRKPKQWLETFHDFSSDFKTRLENIGPKPDPECENERPPVRLYVPWSQEDSESRLRAMHLTFADELSEECHQFQQLLGKAPLLRTATKHLEAAIVDLKTALPSISYSDSGLDPFDDEVASAIALLKSTMEIFDSAEANLKSKLVSVDSAKRNIGYAIANLQNIIIISNKNFKSGIHLSDKATVDLMRSTIDCAMMYIECTKDDIEYEVKTFLKRLFGKLEERVEKAHTTDVMNTELYAFIQAATKSLESYNDMIMDDLFDITTETNLVKEIKDILDELNIINVVKRQQESVTEPLKRHMFSGMSKSKQKDFYDSTRLESHVHELRKTAEATYSALRDLLDLKQKQASAIEARSASKDAKASAAQAEASTSLSAETVRQGWSIMVFTIVTIVFLPLSFFTGIFGMNAKELISGHYSIGFYSAIMYPISLIVISFSLGLALNIEFRLFTTLALREFTRISGLSRLWELRFTIGGSVMDAIEQEKTRRGMGSAHKKWEAGI